MTEKIDWYKVCVLSWAKKNQHIRWQDHVKAEALAMARETAKRIKHKELLLAAEPPKLQVQPPEAKPQDDGEAQDKTGQSSCWVVPRDEARRVPRFMVTRRSKNGYRQD